MSSSFTLCVQRIDTWSSLRGEGSLWNRKKAPGCCWETGIKQDPHLFLLLLQNSCVLAGPPQEPQLQEPQPEPSLHPVPHPMGGRVQLGCTRNRAPRTLVLTRLSLPCPGVPRKSIPTSGESMETEAGAKLSSHGPFHPEGYSYQTWGCA